MKMAASGFTLEAVRNFIVQRGNKVTNHELVTRFKSDLNDPQFKSKNRENFKDFVNTLATIKVDERGEKVLVLKKKFRSDTPEQGQKWNDSQDPRNDIRASSEPPANPGGSDQVDGGGMSKVRSETNITSRETTPDMAMTGSASMGTISMSSAASSTVSQGSQQSIASSADLEDDVNASVISVKDRAKHLNRMETESELQRISHHKKKDIRSRDRERDVDDDSHSSGSTYTSLEPHEREWLVVSASGDYHDMHRLLSKNPDLVRVRDFTNGYTAVHWAAKHGKPEVLKLVLSKSNIDINKRTNGGYTPLHLASMHGHEQIIELLVQTFRADPNIRDFSGKKAKQYLPNSASTKAQRKQIVPTVPNPGPGDITHDLTSSVTLQGPELPSSARSSLVLRKSSGAESNSRQSLRSSIQIQHLSMGGL